MQLLYPQPSAPIVIICKLYVIIILESSGLATLASFLCIIVAYVCMSSAAISTSGNFSICVLYICSCVLSRFFSLLLCVLKSYVFISGNVLFVMAISTLSRVICLSAARNAHVQTFHHGLPLHVPSHYLSQSLTAHSACQPQSLCRLWGKGTVCFQSNPSVKIKTAETYCQTIASFRNTRKYLVQGIQRAIRKTYRTSMKRNRMAWHTASLGMTFLVPSLMKETEKPVPLQVIQPELKRKKRGWWSQLFVNVYEFLCVCLRALRLLATFTPILMLYPVTYLGKTATDTWWGLLLTG